LSNAIKFTPSRGKITISTEVEDKGSIRLSITDTGIGINDDEVDKALSPFTQLDGGDLGRQNSGTGLGLTLVNALIKMHNGRLELVSQKGIGTTATLIFPLDRVLPKNISHDDLEMMAKKDDLDEQVEPLEEPIEEQQADVFGSSYTPKSAPIEMSNVNIYAEYEKELDAREAAQKAKEEAEQAGDNKAEKEDQ
ncbi:MAG: ATP-binding protein, partial [Pseudomonadota bacterium]|nr:ATP-binding protein [Pseudomonadota bacterium]